MKSETIFLPETDSTNSVAYALAEKGAGSGTAVVARKQSAGRGRLGKQWQSPAGKGLYCSIIARPRIEIIDYPLITMTAGLGIALALEYVCGIEFQLKWPNDIYRRGLKCGGILVETSPLQNHQKEKFAVIGIGINVNNRREDFPSKIVDKATSLYLECGKDFELNALLETIRRQLMVRLQQLEESGFSLILDQWCCKDLLIGKQLKWVTQKRKVIKGKSLGPDERGRLHVQDKNGQVHEVLSGDISLVKDL